MSRGAIWRKWDLHFHTPSSYDYDDKSVSNENIIDVLSKNSISVVAITDHHTIDVKKITELQKLAKTKDITVLPGIELRTDKGGSESIHIIGIFSEDSDIQSTWDKIKGSLELTEQDIKEKGNDSLYCFLESSCDLIHKNNGLVTIHAGRKSNSLENISNSLDHKTAQKVDILKHIDIFELGQIKDIEDYKKNVLPNICHIKNPPMIICSDNHNIKDYKLKTNLWVKADPNFRGLKQIINEADGRVINGECPPIFEKVKNNRTKYIKKLQIYKKADSKLDETWFNNISIKFNHKLIAIIGNKGSGKSALSDIIGLLGNSKNINYFSFLNKTKFYNKQNKANNFIGKLIWESDEEEKKTLSDKPSDSSYEKVKYIPQNFFETICNDIDKSNQFEDELKKVIFTHVKEENKLGTNNLDDLIKYKTEGILSTQEIIKKDIEKLNEEIIKLEKKKNRDYKISIEGKLKNKKSEYENHKKNEPEAVIEPVTNEEYVENIKIKIERKTVKKQKVEIEIEKNKKDKVEFSMQLQDLKNCKQKIECFKNDYIKIEEQYKAVIENLGIPFHDIIKLKINNNILDDKINTLETYINNINEKLDFKNPNSLFAMLPQFENEINALQSKLDEPQKKYQEYLKELENWKKTEQELIGSKDKTDTLTYYEELLKYIDTELDNLLLCKRNDRCSKVKKLYEQKLEIVSIYKELYQPITEFLKKYEEINTSYKINFDVSLQQKDFNEKFIDYINQSVKGSFYGKDQGIAKLHELTSIDFNNEADVLNFLDNIIFHLENDKREGQNNQIREIEKQLKDYLNFYNYLFNLDYVQPYYKLKLDDKELLELSPGEKGALLLIFYLILDQDDIPLILDQPEDNLDNQSIYKVLVPFIKEAKKRRQIIIVTHNPNIAVVCDAEQIINVQIDKGNKNEFSVYSGAIETSKINTKIIDILEGTKPAFDLRATKYKL